MDLQQAKYEEQINNAVLGFVQVWNRFESTLARELAGIHKRLDGMHPEKESHPNANYELFYRVASSINTRKSLTMGELSAAISVPLSTATRIADWLVERGYMQRLPDPEDRRVVRVALTTNGHEIFNTMENHIRERVQQILTCLSVGERETLFALLGKVAGTLEKVSK